MSMKVSSARSHSKKVESGPGRSAEVKRTDAQPKPDKVEQKKGSSVRRFEDGWGGRTADPSQPRPAPDMISNRRRGGDGTVSVNYVPERDGDGTQTISNRRRGSDGNMTVSATPGQDGCGQGDGTQLINNRRRGGDGNMTVSYVPEQPANGGVCQASPSPLAPYRPPTVQYA